MITVDFTYNPYLIKTQIEVNGQVPQDKELAIAQGIRLQEWVEDLPKILTKKYNDKIRLNYTGTNVDFEDVKAAFERSGVPCSLALKDEKFDVDKAEEAIVKIYKDIQHGPIQDLKTSAIKEAFTKARSSEFEVNVVATMSSGKSTLINALLGRKLMPAKNEATTATIVKIKDVDGKKDFSAVAYSKQGKKIVEFPKVTLKDMQSLNDNPNVYEIHIEGDVEFVSSEGMSLILVDTPGPNNSRDIQHQEMTFKMLEGSDKSLVLFVMNGRQLGINDEKVFLDFICNNMKKGGKKTRDRYIFAINQLDAFKPNPDDDGEDCIEKALSSVRASLNERGITEANIFPVSAGVALEHRIDDEDEELLHPFKKKAKRYPAMRLNEYTKYTHLPSSSVERLKDIMKDNDLDDNVEYYSGICSIEEAIRLYINKYARTTKVCDLVLSFNNRLNELATLARLENEIRKDASKKRKLRAEIDKAKDLITNSKHTQDLTNEIDRTNYTAEAERDIVTAISDAKRQFRGLVSGKSYKVDIVQAQAQSNTISTQFSQCAAQVNVRINGIIENSFKNTLSKVINQYLSQLAILGVTPQSLMLGSYSGRFVTTPDMNKKLKANKSEYDESYIIQESYREKVESTKGTYGRVGALSGAGIGAIVGSIVPVIGTGVGALVGGIFGLITGRTSGESEHYVTKYRPKKIEKYVDYVNMHEVATSASHDFDQLMDEIQQKALDYMSRENDKIKKSIKVKLQEIDLLLLKKLEDLQTLENSDKKTAEEMAKKEKDLAWLTRIQTRVNELIDF